MIRFVQSAIVLLATIVSVISANAQTTFNVTVATKTAAHPYFGQGDAEGYVIDGVEGKEIVVIRGVTYRFQMNAVPGNHPFYLTTSPIGGGEEVYSDDVTNNEATGTEVLTFTPSATTPDLLYYQCSFHPNLGWKINVQGSVTAVDESMRKSGVSLVSWPNPVTDRATLAFTSGTNAVLHVDAYDVLGRKVLSVYDGHVSAGEPLNIGFDAQTLSPGMYKIRATGDGISVTTTVIVL